ncbi:MAG TPA: phosphate ABC transporter ATP-binding protein PstB [Gemmatimonadales bacterium]|nr:phosphate ABC transporter ATP-binding protein PstB [Gemmatimonadales bacterium]
MGATVSLPRAMPTGAGPEPAVRLSTHNLTAWYGSTSGVRDVSLDFRDHSVTALIGPSGCGKSTLLRSLNRMHELVPGARVTGTVKLDGYDIYAPGVNPIQVRRRIGMVFQKPTPFPSLTIAENVAAGLKVGPRLTRAQEAEIVERALRRAALWDEVKDRLRHPATELSGGQQQRLCVARTIAPEPDVILLDEPTASLDPIGTARIEELVHELKREFTVVIVTHNMQQAARVSDVTAFFYLGELVEVAPTAQLFTTPREPRTEAYITGRFG